MKSSGNPHKDAKEKISHGQHDTQNVGVNVKRIPDPSPVVVDHQEEVGVDEGEDQAARQEEVAGYQDGLQLKLWFLVVSSVIMRLGGGRKG